MQKKTLLNLNLELYEDKLSNGLEIYVVPKNVNGIYATFSTKFGSIHNTFVPIGEEELITVPNGIAHFLEHKVFEQEDETDPFTFFSERGADANANTSQIKTTYLFSGTTFFKENLNYLFDYVQSPYFTDENVEKEKGIIEQEILMYQDDPFSRIYEQSLFNSFVKISHRLPIAGTIETIRKITKEDLYKCYNTFYHPANMFVVVTGNVNPDEVYDIIKTNQEKKSFPSSFKTVIRHNNEPDHVFKKEEILEMNVTIPKIAFNYKFNISNLNYLKRHIINYIGLFFDIKLGLTSSFYEKMQNDNILTSGLEISYIETDKHLLIMLFADTKEPEKLIENIQRELENLEISEEEFNRKKKLLLSSYLYMSDNIYQINHKIMNNIVKEGEVITDAYQEYSNYNVQELNDIINKLSFEHHNYVIIKPKNN
ncbi:MAG: insulinase family protein [Mollicutes bacterium]|nr:insulinase family protein [Mollicutes bacterium]